MNLLSRFWECLLGVLARHNPHRGTHSAGWCTVLGQGMGQRVASSRSAKIAPLNKEKRESKPCIVSDRAGLIFLLLPRIPECLERYIVEFYRERPMCSWKRTLLA